ncbi:MAG: fold metallo-hydrolase [Flavipsychrobacter sp.]|jgi:phosphoribosyl 1,2-cyclic phosphodiesterase|nr:fold metallo-hydrolase [Flavipsychrobacter sp.]
MSLYIASLNSGSNGNCYYVGNDSEAVLIDAGISCREIERRLRRLNLSINKIKAVFISHEHIDHVRGMQVIATKHQVPIYITAATLQNSRMRIDSHLVRTFKPHEPVQVGGLAINAFPKEHDAIDPYSFVIEGNGVHVGVFTDIGITCEHLISNFKKCHAAFLEANYDEVMLEEGNYPIHLKRRIRGGKGHLSNKQALELFMGHRPSHMSHLVLSHLSKNNNRPEIVSELFSPYNNELNIVVASRYNESEVFKVFSDPANMLKRNAKQEVVQVSLF